jgi:hypothetical protein
MTEKTKWVSIQEAAKIAHVNPPRVYALANSGRLSCQKRKGKRIAISLASIDRFLQNKYERRRNGTLLFDIEKGEYNAPAAAKLLGITPNRMYSMIRHGVFPVERKGRAYILQRMHLEEMFKKMYAHVPNLEFGA